MVRTTLLQTFLVKIFKDFHHYQICHKSTSFNKTLNLMIRDQAQFLTIATQNNNQMLKNHDLVNKME